MKIAIHHPGLKNVVLRTSRYALGPLTVELWSRGEPYLVLSVCLPELTLADNEFAFKTWSKNVSLYQQLLDQGVNEFIRFEFCTVGCVPICRLAKTVPATGAGQCHEVSPTDSPKTLA
ncbi:MAG: hypothetical protein R3C59_09970 [Planctomycetaceae bacterium]